MSKYLSYILLFGLLTNSSLFAQRALTLQQCFDEVTANYPLIKQKGLTESARDFNVSNAVRGYLPQVNFTAQGTYQSDVTELPIKISGMKVDPITKDQYKAVLDITQVIRDGGTISAQVDMHSASSIVELQKTEADLRKVKEQAQQLFFSLLLLDAQIEQAKLLQKDINTGLNKLQSASANGVASANDVYVMKAEYLKSVQRETDLQMNRSACNDMLCLLLGAGKVNMAPALPEPLLAENTPEIKRPELQMFTMQHQLIEAQRELTLSKVMPKISLFAQGGYGKPGLNMLKNEFSLYYVAGARLSWQLSGFYTNSNEREVLKISDESVKIQQEVFIINTKMQMQQQYRDAEKMQALLKSDDEILELRAKIKSTALAQLENGVITSNDYIREINQEDSARLNKALHEVQLRMAQYAIKLTSGN
ncbi:MAG: TolC family protein [Ignavibacteriales bacterium]|nr:TolC family protein [Ignavibacteriales bacterium]